MALTLVEQSAASVATPASGKNSLYFDSTSGSLAYKDDGGTVHAIPFPGRTDDGNSGTAKTIDWTDGLPHKVTLTGNCTFTFSNPTAGGVYILELAQDATGSRTVTWPAAVHWSGGTAPTLTTTASKVDIFTFYYNGTTYFGVTSGLNYTA